MIRAHVVPFFRHFRQRAKAVLSSPAALLVMLGFGAVATLLWPESVSLPGAETPIARALEHNQVAVLVWVVWLYLWPSLPALYSRGQAEGRGGTASLSTAGSPPLPIHPNTRALAESLLALLLTAIVRVGLLSAFGDEPLLELLRETAAGSLVVLPVLLAWTVDSANLNLFMLRPVVTAGMLAFLMFGWSSGWIALAGASAAISVLVLESRRLEGQSVGLRWPRSSVEDRHRQATGARRQLGRDTWLQPVKGWSWAIALCLGFYGVVLFVDSRGFMDKYGFFIAFELYLIVFLQVVFRPLGSTLALEGLIGKHGARRGDFLRAWSVLPVAPRTVLRQVWFHGLGFGLALWGVPTLMLVLRTWMNTGSFGLRAADGGNLSDFVLGGFMVVPMIAGFLVSACAGRKVETVVSGVSILFGVHTVLIVRVVLSELFGRGSLQAEIPTAVYALVLVVLAGLFPLRLLRRNAVVEL